MVDHDTLSQGSGSFQFQSGDLYWHHDNGSYSTHLTGEIRLDDANGSCARMRLVYFDDGAELATKYGGTVCAEDGEQPRLELERRLLREAAARAFPDDEERAIVERPDRLGLGGAG